ncbi:hypothetical protein ES332_D03G066800v1, partial [Gossypium tomentosum]
MFGYLGCATLLGSTSRVLSKGGGSFLISLLGFVGVFRPASSVVLSSWFLVIGWVEVWLFYFLGVDPGCVVLLDSMSRLLLKVFLFYFPLNFDLSLCYFSGCKWTVNGLFNLAVDGDKPRPKLWKFYARTVVGSKTQRPFVILNNSSL